MEAEVTETDEETTLQWKDRVAHLRRMQDDGGGVPVSIVDWTVTDDETAVDVTFKTLHDQSTHHERVEAPTPTNSNSGFEQLLDAAGCSLEHADELGTGEAEDLRAVPTNPHADPDEIEWSLLEAVESSQSDTDNGTQPVAAWMEDDSVASRDEVRRWYLLCGFFGPLMLPLTILALRFDSFNSNITYKEIGTGAGLGLLSVVAWWFGMMLVF